MEPAGFVYPEATWTGSGKKFARGLVLVSIGLSAVFAISFLDRSWSDDAIGWLGIAALPVTIHLGLGDVLSGFAQYLGWNAGPLFDEPLKSRTLNDFWTQRWNRPFVEMDRQLLIRPIARLIGLRSAVFAVFLVSGLFA
jgi:alginate O-acetyltransferase complex protein AlgI